MRVVSRLLHYVGKHLGFTDDGKKRVLPGVGSLRLRRGSRGVIYWRRPSTLSFLFSIFAALSVGLALLSSSIPIAPMIWYRVFPGTSSALARILARPTVSFGDLLETWGERPAAVYQPPLDPSLPLEGRLIISKIGVDSPITEESAANYEQALRKGIWRVPDLGTPFDRRLPTILVAHRFGYLSWSNAYRRRNSFFSLPKLDPGDRVEVIWQQRRYVYEVYGGGESELVTDYQADLILYTCKFLESPERIFRYARLLES